MFNYTSILEQIPDTKIWRLVIKFSDNPYYMFMDYTDICYLLQIQSDIDRQVKKFVRHETNIIKTSGLGFRYTKDMDLVK